VIEIKKEIERLKGKLRRARLKVFIFSWQQALFPEHEF